MGIKLVEDVGAPLAVVAADLITETAAPTWNEPLAYIAAIGGYVSAQMGFGGDFMKNVGIASLPWAAKKLYIRIKGMTAAPAGRMAFRPSVSRYPSQAEQSPFEGIRLV